MTLASGYVLDASTRRWRALQAISELDTEGEYPLELRLLDADVGPYAPLDEVDLQNALQEVRAGRIPKRSRKALRDVFVERATWLGPLWVVVAVLFTGFVPALIEDGGLALAIFLYFFFLIGALVVPTVLSWRLRRDVREQRLRIEEGELTRKWIRPAVRRKDPGPWKRFATAVSAALAEEPVQPRVEEASVDLMRVRIGGRWHDVRSHAVFAQLGFGVRYRMYLSARAGRLIAIESVEREVFAGYRDAPAGAPRSTAVDEPGDRARRSRP